MSNYFAVSESFFCIFKKYVLNKNSSFIELHPNAPPELALLDASWFSA